MPRPNQERTIGAERRLALRIETEREIRGWSLKRLSDEMAAAGCPVDPSALFKTVKGDPPRRITVDEAVAASTVFNIPLERLVGAPSETVRSRASALDGRRRGPIAPDNE